MRSAVLIMMLCAAAPVVSQTPAVQPQPCSTPEYRQFDFWVGAWEVRGPKGAVVGTNRIERVENGCALQENWVGTGGITGRSINAYSNADRQWHQAWIGSGGQFLHLVGGWRGNEMILEGQSMNTASKPTIERVTWTPMPRRSGPPVLAAVDRRRQDLDDLLRRDVLAQIVLRRRRQPRDRRLERAALD